MIETKTLPDLSDTEWYLNVSPHDLGLYFSDTFLRIERLSGPRRHPKEWVQVSHFKVGDTDLNSDGGADDQTEDIPAEECQICYYRGTDHERHTPRIKNVAFEFGFPEVGLYNYRDSVVHFQRTTTRQNRKGLCGQTAVFFGTHHLLKKFIALSGGFHDRNHWRWDCKNLTMLFDKPNLLSFPRAFDSVRKLHALNRAFDRNFSLSVGVYSTSPSLWFRRTLIGQAVSPSKIVVRHPVFLEEAKDYFIPKGVDIDVDNA
jgi:hypothetical protein